MLTRTLRLPYIPQLASAHRDVEMVQVLLIKGAAVNVRNDKG